nr:hypothetical protein [Gammaproteobacteria bacterium]
MNTSVEHTDFSGAMALLRDCVGGKAGERLLIVSEPESFGVYDHLAAEQAAAAGRALGMFVYEMESHEFVNNDEEKAILLDSLRGFDHIVFFSRVGDQIRFSSLESVPSTTMCYTLNQDSLNSKFGTACHDGMAEVKQAIDTAFETSEFIRVTCPLGTDYHGTPAWAWNTQKEVSVKRFPLLVPQPIPSAGFSGKVALSRFLIGTGSNFYDPYHLALPRDVLAHVE